ncbi:peptidoglycan/LPS O-acetylase OafA/YrhL [Rhizobium sp. PP-F2F-G20b]|nr:peptidoglycan/LPS O-acetylase OafA/YrhL [Rhizobium sp. PP-F2F-G20b]
MRATRHIASLDGLRGIAAFLVVMSHVALLYPHLPGWFSLNIGAEAVEIFFALSGFLMASLYAARPLDRVAATDYLVHRFARIYPVYLVAVLFVVLLSLVPGLDYIHPIHGPVEILRHVVLLGSSGVFWSVPPEIQFYFFFLLVWLCLSSPRRYRILALFLVACVAVDAVFDFPGPGILLPSKIHFFMAGVAAGLLYASGRLRPKGWVVGVATLGLLGFVFLSKILLWRDQQDGWGLVMAVTAGVIVFLTAQEHVLSRALLASPPLRFLGKISFSLYLFHVPVMFLSMKTLGLFVPGPVAVVLSVCLAVVFATYSYHLIEDPVRRRLVERWKRHRARSAVVAQSELRGRIASTA